MAGGLIAPDLGEHLDRAWRTPFCWGAQDCLLFPADWCVLQGGQDPAATWRGRYRTRLGAHRLMSRAGGLEALAAAEMAAAGYPLADSAIAGDVGVVEVLTAKGPGPVGAIFTGELWAVLGASGLFVQSFRPTQVWRVPCRRL